MWSIEQQPFLWVEDMVSNGAKLTTNQGRIQLPSYLERAILKAQEVINNLPTEMISAEAAEKRLQKENGIPLHVQAEEALVAAAIYKHLRQSEGLVQAAAIYSDRQARVLAEKGKGIEAINLVGEAVQLLHDFIPLADPRHTRIFVDQLSDLISGAFELYAFISVREVMQAIPRLENLLHIAQVVWEPVFRESLGTAIRLLPTLLNAERLIKEDDADALDLMRDILGQLNQIRKQVGKVSLRVRGKNRVYANSLTRLLEAWQQIIQQQLVLLAKVREVESALIDHRQLATQVWGLIAEVERNLRALVAQKYEGQYGEGWLEHIRSKHERMYQYWMRNLRKDKAAFQLYQEFAPSILEYARFEDLLELVTAQWHLFRGVFDFGYDRRNKAVFQDKMQHIAKVRNPLAHQRSVPENELLRALVLCNDILKAIELFHGD